MKKLLLVLLGIIIVSFLIKIFVPLSYFSTRNTTAYSEPPNKIPDIISPFINKPILGIHYRLIDKQTADQNNIVEGAYITQVIADSPAEKAGLKEEDIITEIDNRIIIGLQEQSVYDLVSTLKPGAKISLKIWRNKEVKTVLIILD